MYDKIKNNVLFNEIRRMCRLLSKYDKSTFNSAANDDEMSRLEQTASFKIPEELKEIYRIADGFQILGRTAHIYSLSNVGCKIKDIPEEYVVFGEIVGDGEKLCFHENTGDIVTIHCGRIFRYSVRGFLEYCVDQCMDGFFMSKVEMADCLDLRSDILRTIQKIYNLKSVTIGELADKFVQASNADKEVIMYDLPIIIRAAIFGSLENALCVEFLNYLKNKDEVMADNLIRGMRRRAIDNFFNRERKFLDDSNASFPWNVKQMREIYNFDDKGMCYQNAGMANAYDPMGNIVKEFSSNRTGARKLLDKKIEITYMYDVYTNVRYAGNINNIKLKG